MSIYVFLHDENSKLEGNHKHIFENDKILKIFVFLINQHHNINLIKNINILVNPLISDVRPEDHPSLEMEVHRAGRSTQNIC